MLQQDGIRDMLEWILVNPVEQISTDHYPSFDMDTGGEEESMEHCLEYYMPGWHLLQESTCQTLQPWCLVSSFPHSQVTSSKRTELLCPLLM